MFYLKLYFSILLLVLLIIFVSFTLMTYYVDVSNYKMEKLCYKINIVSWIVEFILMLIGWVLNMIYF